jgi:hypothetical protein
MEYSIEKDVVIFGGFYVLDLSSFWWGFRSNLPALWKTASA